VNQEDTTATFGQPGGRIVSVTLAAAGTGPASVPEGTTASRCTACGETRLRYRGDPTDEWKHHFDYCGQDNQDEQPQEYRPHAPEPWT
jgi:hypothetical protein